MRGRGIGTRLLVALLRRAGAAHSAITLSVRTDNPALRLYERLGFRAVEGSDMENRVGEVSVMMKADLADEPSRSRP
ncbi:MAG: GNAT family N-acetyltransferase [Egibacteraceae bacterium]